MTSAEHHAEAERLLARSMRTPPLDDSGSDYPLTDAQSRAYREAALIHAVLALAPNTYSVT